MLMKMTGPHRTELHFQPMSRETDSTQNLIDKKLVSQMLYGDDEYISEFAEASVQSFTEFKINFRVHLTSDNLDELRRAGHKIKPVALMLHLEELVEMYEKAKGMIEENRPTSEKKEMVEKVEDYCEKVIREFQTMIE